MWGMDELVRRQTDENENRKLPFVVYIKAPNSGCTEFSYSQRHCMCNWNGEAAFESEIFQSDTCTWTLHASALPHVRKEWLDQSNWGNISDVLGEGWFIYEVEASSEDFM